MYPVTGASGGAILSPLASIPTQLVNLDPCHNNILQVNTSHNQSFYQESS